MTKCTEALSEKELAALRLTASHPAEVVGDDGEVCGEIPDSLVRRLLVTLDACDAREAVLVEELEFYGDERHWRGKPVTKAGRMEFVSVISHDGGSHAHAALANRSPAAAALLAQGERLREVKEYCEKGRSLGDDDVASEVLAIIHGVQG